MEVVIYSNNQRFIFHKDPFYNRQHKGPPSFYIMK
jgi:hypothetical protein